jgi:hypothetical protein
MMTEGSGSESIALTNGSGSGRPKNMWIRIRNTGMEDSEEMEDNEGIEGNEEMEDGWTMTGLRIRC